ncbi:hypothetical protein RQP46_009582 [Phenoliferia psychrophenolica]
MNYRRKTTQGLSVWLYVGWILSGLCYGPYAIFLNINIPMIIQPQSYGSLCAIVFIQMLYYDRKWTKGASVAAFVGYAVVGAGWEVGIWQAMKAAARNGVKGVDQAFGILSAIFLSGGFIPQIYQIWRDREVVGVSYAFLAIDSLGAVCSIMSLGFKQQIDGIALANYIGVFVVEVVVMVSALYLNPRATRRRALQVADEKDSPPPTAIGEEEEDNRRTEVA